MNKSQNAIQLIRQNLLPISLILLGLISFFWLAPWLSNTNFHAGSIDYLTEKSETVLALTASSTALSAAITLIPGDVAMPIANQLADFNTYFIILLCAIYLEKYLLTITSIAAFKILIPLACALGILWFFKRNEFIARAALKIGLFGLVIFAIVPTSVTISKVIDQTYQYNIQETIQEADKITGDASEEESTSEKEEQNWLDKIKDTVGNSVNTITNGASDLLEKAKSILNEFVEAIAVMIITSCVIPILVFASFIWAAKLILGININIPKLPTKSNKRIKGVD